MKSSYSEVGEAGEAVGNIIRWGLSTAFGLALILAVIYLLVRFVRWAWYQ